MTVLCDAFRVSPLTTALQSGQGVVTGQQVPVLVSDLSRTCWVTLFRDWPLPLGVQFPPLQSEVTALSQSFLM